MTFAPSRRLVLKGFGALFGASALAPAARAAGLVEALVPLSPSRGPLLPNWPQRPFVYDVARERLVRWASAGLAHRREVGDGPLFPNMEAVLVGSESTAGREPKTEAVSLFRVLDECPIGRAALDDAKDAVFEGEEGLDHFEVWGVLAASGDTPVAFYPLVSMGKHFSLAPHIGTVTIVWPEDGFLSLR